MRSTIAAAVAALAFFQQAQPQPSKPPVPATQPEPVAVRPIEPPRTPLPSEADSAKVVRFSFIAYGDTRGPNDATEVYAVHKGLVSQMIARATALAGTPFPVRFVVQSGDAVTNGRNGTMWNTAFNPVVDMLTGEANLPYFFAVGNHDVTTLPIDNPERMLGLKNTIDAMSKLWPADGSVRRLKGYPTFSFGYGNAFFLVIDSNIAADPAQLAWTTKQLESLDRKRYHHVIAVFHNPPFSSGPHGGEVVEPQTDALRALYLPLLRKHHVRMTLTGHDHLLDHWVERFDDGGKTYRIDHIVSGGGGAPTYTYKGEPDLTSYLDKNKAQKVRIEHVIRPGATVADNPFHFLIIRVDGDRLSLEVIGPEGYKPYGRDRVELDDPAS
jgi:hypothetical protein